MFKILFIISLLCLQHNSFSKNIAPEFTALFDSKTNAVLIGWKHTSPATGTYLIQRSADNNTWADIALQAVIIDTQNRLFSFADTKPSAAKNFYRLKFIAVNDGVEFSKEVMVIIPAASNNWVMYPVPVTDMLTLDYRGTEPVRGVINIFIQRSTGTIITRLRSSSLNKIFKIPVGNLGKGIYDIIIIVGGEVVWNQRFVK